MGDANAQRLVTNSFSVLIPQEFAADAQQSKWTSSDRKRSLLQTCVGYEKLELCQLNAQRLHVDASRSADPKLLTQQASKTSGTT